VSADLHFDFGQAMLDFPLLLGKLGVEREILRLDGVKTLS
jgi:hypothetical protein